MPKHKLVYIEVSSECRSSESRFHCKEVPALQTLVSNLNFDSLLTLSAFYTLFNTAFTALYFYIKSAAIS